MKMDPPAARDLRDCRDPRDRRLRRQLLTVWACALMAMAQSGTVFAQDAAAPAQGTATPAQSATAPSQTAAPPSRAADRPASQIVTADRAFATVPFEKWLAEGDQGAFHWTARVSPGELSRHQRLRTRIELQVDGSDVAARHGRGFLVMLIQFEDADHRLYRTHGSIDLQQITEAAAKSDIVYTQDAFMRPGEYRVSLVMFDARTGEHSALQRKVRVNPLKSDPLPQSWDNLPAVEFTPLGDAPDSWYLPQVEGRLKLPLETRRPVLLEVVVNASPTASGTGARTGQVNNRSLADLLPALKVISHVTLPNGTLHVSLLDLTRQSVLFEQDSAGDLDWPSLRAALMQADPNKIDARSLARRGLNAQFFVGQLRQRLRLAEPAAQQSAAANHDDEPVRVGIVLSSPMPLDSGEDRHPIEAAAGSGRKLFYIRFHAIPLPAPEPPLLDPMRAGRRNAPILSAPQLLPQEPLDALANLVKPLQPRLFDVYTPEQFRKALAALIEEVSRL